MCQQLAEASVSIVRKWDKRFRGLNRWTFRGCFPFLWRHSLGLVWWCLFGEEGAQENSHSRIRDTCARSCLHTVKTMASSCCWMFPDNNTATCCLQTEVWWVSIRPALLNTPFQSPWEKQAAIWTCLINVTTPHSLGWLSRALHPVLFFRLTSSHDAAAAAQCSQESNPSTNHLPSAPSLSHHKNTFFLFLVQRVQYRFVGWR